MDVTLHLGAHRTGTTTLQKYLENNRDNLNEIGTEFWGPNRTRSGLFSGLVKRPDSVVKADTIRGERSCGLIRMELERFDRAGVKSLIVSEENMIGVMLDNLRRGRLYPDVRPRLERFSGAFEKHCRRVAISIRSYDKYWASVLAFTVERGRKMPEAQDLDRLVTQPRRWRDVICEVAAIFPAAEVVVWPFEGMIGQVDSQLAVLNDGVVPVRMRGRNDWHNASAGCAKLRQVLEDRQNTIRSIDMPNEYSRWQPFRPHHITALQAQYDEDIAWLRNGADGIATYEENSGSGLAGKHLRPLNVERGQLHDKEERGVG